VLKRCGAERHLSYFNILLNFILQKCQFYSSFSLQNTRSPAPHRSTSLKNRFIDFEPGQKPREPEPLKITIFPTCSDELGPRIVSKDLGEEEQAILIESSSEASQQSDAEDWQFKTHVTAFQPLPVQKDSSDEKISLIDAIAALEKKWNGEESCNKAEISLESEKSAFEIASSTESATVLDFLRPIFYRVFK
jgi:hypothetical protein